MKNKIYIWCSDTNKNSGEGILGNKFINDLRVNNPEFKYVIKYPKINKFNPIKKIIGINFERLVIPISGLIYLWFIHISKKNKKICYVNYLPLWNFIIFLLLPPNTILGPITGGSKFSKKFDINYILRKYILNFFSEVSLLILSYRYNKLLFATNLLEQKKLKKKNYFFNYVLKDIKFKKRKFKKKYDLIFYLRDHKNKNTDYQIKLANHLASNLKIITIGMKINNKLIKNLGFISRKKVCQILKKTKLAFISSENLYSFFSLDCYENGTYIIHNHLEKQNIFTGNNFYLKKDQILKVDNKIKKIISNYKIPSKFKIKKNLNFTSYFKI